MPQSKDKKVCEKCGGVYYCDEHHILPKGIFGEKGNKVTLCKNCHFECHKYTGFKYLRKKNQQPEEFYLKKYAAWIVSAILIGIIVYNFIFI